MNSFDDLPLGPETVAALAAEGIEVPTPFQALAIPVIARGNDLLGRAGPGSGTLLAYGVPLADRLEGGKGSPACVVLCTGVRQATQLARSFARFCDGTGHRASALAAGWHGPESADFLFVPAERFKALYDGSVETSMVEAVVVHDGDGFVSAVPGDRLELFLSSLGKDCQRIFCGLPLGPKFASLARRFARRAVTVPPATPVPSKGPVRDLHLLVVEKDWDEAVLEAVTELLQPPVRHVLVFAASADQAADLGDFLALHGRVSGPPGDESAPVWLSPGDDHAAAEALTAMSIPAEVATLSASVPPGRAAAAARHAEGGPAWVLASVRELGHLKEVAAGAGLRLRRVRPARPARVSKAVDQLADAVHKAARAPEAAPYYLLVESLLDRFTAAEVAAAALLLLDKERSGGLPADRATSGPEPPPSWVRLFLSAGERDGIGPGDLLGAITSEAGIEGKRVGRIDVRASHSLVEVREGDAKKVIAALNGITLGGRALRADYDRGKTDRRGGPGGGGPGAPGRGAPGRGGRGRSDGRDGRRGKSGGPGRHDRSRDREPRAGGDRYPPGRGGRGRGKPPGRGAPRGRDKGGRDRP